MRIVKSYNKFSKTLYLRSLTGFWIQQSLNKYSLNFRVTLHYILCETYSEPCLLLLIQTWEIYILFRHIVVYLEPSLTLVYSEPCHIQNPGIFIIQYVFLNSVKAYSGIFRMLCNTCMLRTFWYSELCYIQNVGIFRTQGIFRSLFI